MTRRITAAEAQRAFHDLLREVSAQQERVLIDEEGVPVAAVVSAADLERLTRLDEEWGERFRVIDEIRARNRAYDPDEIERDVADEIAAMRAERRKPPTQPAP